MSVRQENRGQLKPRKARSLDDRYALPVDMGPHLSPCLPFLTLDSLRKDSSHAISHGSPHYVFSSWRVTGSAFPEKHLCSSGENAFGLIKTCRVQLW